MFIVSFFQNLWKRASSPALYENILILIGGSFVITFIGDFIVKAIDLEGIGEYIVCAIVTTILLYGVNCLIIYYRVAKPLKCVSAKRPVALASLAPSIPGLLGLLRLIKRVPGVGRIFAMLLDRVFVRAIVSMWPSFIYSTLALTTFSCQVHI